jgi:hypothetical protein
MWLTLSPIPERRRGRLKARATSTVTPCGAVDAPVQKACAHSGGTQVTFQRARGVGVWRDEISPRIAIGDAACGDSWEHT